MKSLRTFTDEQKTTRKNGEEWLIKLSDTETHIPGVHEEVVGVVRITTLSNRHYCVIMNPVDENGRPQLGKRKLIRVSLIVTLFILFNRCSVFAQYMIPGISSRSERGKTTYS